MAVEGGVIFLRIGGPFETGLEEAPEDRFHPVGHMDFHHDLPDTMEKFIGNGLENLDFRPFAIEFEEVDLFEFLLFEDIRKSRAVDPE